MKKTLVGRTTVLWDSHGDPYRFERGGVEVPCVCDPETGKVCVKHDMYPDAPYREVALRRRHPPAWYSGNGSEALII